LWFKRLTTLYNKNQNSLCTHKIIQNLQYNIHTKQEVRSRFLVPSFLPPTFILHGISLCIVAIIHSHIIYCSLPSFVPGKTNSLRCWIWYFLAWLYLHQRKMQMSNNNCLKVCWETTIWSSKCWSSNNQCHKNQLLIGGSILFPYITSTRTIYYPPKGI